MSTVQTQHQHDYHFPLSFAQQRLWLFQQMQPDTTAYNITGALRFSGKLDTDALQRAIRSIMLRHEILRTTFRQLQGEPVQWVQADIEFQLEQHTVRGDNLQQQLNDCRKIAEQMAQHVFDLCSGPLIKLRLLSLDEHETVLLSVVHHIISDGWSMGVFVNELMQFYTAYLQDLGEPELPELSIQYGDYALWQRDWFIGERRSSQLQYWQQQLKGLPALITLPTDFPRPAVQGYQGATTIVQLSEVVTSDLRALANQYNVTLNMVLLSVYFLLLHRYSQEQDLVVGTPVANRNQHELEGLIGFFANTLVLRVNVEPGLSFNELLQTVKATSLTAFEHQDCPFEQLVDALSPERSLSYAPIIQTLFSFQAAPDQSFSLPGVEISQLQLERNNAQFDLALMAIDNVDSIDLEFGYNTDLFKAKTVSAMVRHFQTVCAALAVDPSLPCGSVPLMQTDEMQSVLSAWNQSQTVTPANCNVLAEIDQQTRLNPRAIAVVCGQQSLNYIELQQQSQHIARLLIKAGVGQGDLVGLCVESGVEMLVAMLAIIRAGAAYVPLDPYYPEQRLQLIVECAGIRHLLSQHHLKTSLEALSRQRQLSCLYIDELLQAETINISLPVIRGEQLIYMIFTSGSTGVPKGAAIQHQSFANLVLNWYISKFDLSAAQSTLICTSISFDLTQKNFFAPLVTGGTVYFNPQRDYDPSVLLELIEQHQIGWINTTPSAFYPLTDAAIQQPASLNSLRYVFLGGETISLQRMQPWLDSARQTTRIVNSYGPTESTDVCMYFDIETVDDYLDKTVPLGVAIDNVRLYVVDQALNPLPCGVPGELCIGGVGVGVGYLNDTARSAERFLPDPFSEQPGSRLYRTGDLVKFSTEQGFEFLGRSDHQVKLRGFRIDLGEIELCLSAHQSVINAVAMVRTDASHNSVLTAYLVSGSALDLKNLRDELAAQLPHYMVPQQWLIVDEFPLTASGKVDRQALAERGAHVIEDAADRQAPENDIEVTLLEIWQDVLQVSEIGTRHNFFDLGGHSLSAVQIVSRVKQAFNLDIPISVVFEKPTIIEQSEWILTSQFESLGDAEQLQLLAELDQHADQQPHSSTG